MKTQYDQSSRPTADLTSVLDLLRWRALHHPERCAFIFSGDDGADAPLTYGELDRRARSVAGLLQDRIQPGDRALLVYPPGLPFLTSFFGCLYAGVVAVPVYPPRPNRSMLRLRAIVADCEPTAVLTTESLRGEAGRWSAPVPELAKPIWLATDAGAEAGADADRQADAWRDPGACLLYTSPSPRD